MANPGAGNKFASVNLNKSYGQSANQNLSNSSYGSGRARSGVHGGSGGGGMVVLSRPRSSHKAGPKLSVPPPLNLPSIRKEHERFDPSGPGTGSMGGVGSGSGARPTSSGIGWSKPSSIPLVERDAVGGRPPLSRDGTDLGDQASDVAGKGSSTIYMPPPSKFGSGGPEIPPQVQPVGKASVLRGEDFPSLKATLTGTNGSSQRQKDGLKQKQRQETSEEFPSGLRDGLHLSSHIDMRPQVQSSQQSVANDAAGNVGDRRVLGNSRQPEQARKQDEYFPAPLPLVRVNPRSDWADDERDTSHAVMDCNRGYGLPKPEPYWDRDFDLPRSSILPVKPAQNLFDRRANRDDDIRKSVSSEVPIVDLYDTAPSREGREGNSWRSSLPREGINTDEVSGDRNIAGTRGNSINGDRETFKESKYVPPQFGSQARDDYNGGITAGRDVYGKRDAGFGQGGRQQWKNMVESSFGRGSERNMRERWGNESNRYKVDNVQSSLVSKSSFSTSGKGPSLNDPLLNFGREKRSFSRSEKPYVEDPFMKDWESSVFDGRDPLSGGILGVVKRKKDVNKQADFHDPVRESFEAELERVQKMQEQERQRIMEEQERALEMARREEEERQRLSREEEERQLRLEEEAREAAWRAEQERLEAIQKAEEHRIAREEEKRMMLMEEERRKQAAKQKLLELEERMARRKAESASTGSTVTTSEERVHGVGKERDQFRSEDLVSWEDSEKMVESITNMTSCDSPSLNSSFHVGPRAQSLRAGSFAFTDRGRPQNAWRRDVFENGNNSSFLPFDQEIGHLTSGQDAFVGGKAFPRKELYGNSEYMPPRGYYTGGIPEPSTTDFSHAKGRCWNMSGDGDPYVRNPDLDSEFHDSIADKFGDTPWGPSRSRGILHPPYHERVYQNSDPDEPYSYGRSRFPVRQPRVLPPPSLASMRRTAFRGENERAGSSAFDESGMLLNNAPGDEPNVSSYGNVHQEKHEHSAVLDVPDGSNKPKVSDLYRNNGPRCDSQSSLSVSSPPTSPAQLSHDELDESGNSSSALAEGNETTVSGNEAVISSTCTGKENTMIVPSAVSVGDDDEWAMENNESQEQEEYDEDEDGFHEEDEVHDGNDEHETLSREFEEMNLEGEVSASMMENLVLGFDQGVEVEIPNDECERSPRNEETSYILPQVSAGLVEREVSDGSRDNGQNSQYADGLPNDITGISGTVSENQSTVQDMTTQSNNAPQSSMQANLLNSIAIHSGSALSTQQPVASSVKSSFHSSSQPMNSTVSSAQSQGELPVKLQFGLFSGPSLIPSPVPAIQIGSIQMPLHFHPQVGPPLTHMQSSQPSTFQFGQLSYPSPMSQGILPLAPQSMSFVQPNISTSYPLHQKPGGFLSACPSQGASAQTLGKNDLLSLPAHNLPIIPPTPLTVPPVTVLLPGQGTQGGDLLCQSEAGISNTAEEPANPESVSRDENEMHPCMSSYMPSSSNRTSDQMNPAPSSSQSISSVKDCSESIADGQFQAVRGRRFAFTARNAGPKLSSTGTQGSHHDMNGCQRRPQRGGPRMEFRVRQSSDKSQSFVSSLSNRSVPEAKSLYAGKDVGISRRSFKKEPVSDRPKHISRSVDLGQGQHISQETEPKTRADKGSRRETLSGGSGASWHGEGRLKRNISPEGDADAPLQSGVVRVYKQPGIEVPSDEDDFIQVRSKRQMLNDRREQREKEIKAKSSNVKKASRKPRSSAQVSMVNMGTTKMSKSASEEATTVLADKSKTQAVEIEVSAGLNLFPQQLAPIGTPTTNADSQADAKLQTTKLPQTSTVSNVPMVLETSALGATFESKRKAHVGVQTYLSSCGDTQFRQQSLLDETLKTGRVDEHSSIQDHTNSVIDRTVSSSSVLKDMSFSSASTPINSLLAGEKIQFGAVTSTTVLTPSDRAVPSSIGPPGSSGSDLVQRNMSAVQRGCALGFVKDKQSDGSCLNLVDCESEAGAAASAVAVAAISNDEVLGSERSTSTGTISDAKIFGGNDAHGIAGSGRDQQTVSHSKAEETLSVSLPADLSVENPPLSLWPPLPSPHSSSSQILSPFPGGTPSPFPYYDMNPMLGGPIFAFGPHDESNGTQPQLQKSSSSGSGPLGTWPHTSVDSFYGPPARFTSPFISPPGGIPGVQPPPHMVLYNHFPVGQFGQVGLSYMGAAYIPSGKQPDWKHNPTSSPPGIGEGEMNNMNILSTQRNPPNVSAPVQHLAPGSPLLSMASPLALFDVSPFQSSGDTSVGQAQWSQVSASPLHSIPQSKTTMSLQQQAELAVPPQLNHGLELNHGLGDKQASDTSRLRKTQTSSGTVENGHNISVSTGNAANRYAEDLGLVELRSSGDSSKTPGNKNKLSGTPTGNTVKGAGNAQDGAGSRSNQHLGGSSSGFKVLTSSHQKNPSNYHGYQRGGAAQKNALGNEWPSNRKIGFHARNNSSGGERGYPPTKMKQIYVAKQSTIGGSTQLHLHE